MAQITRFPFVSHLRAEPSAHVLQYRNGRLVRSGRGEAFWFTPLDTGLAEVPLDDRELTFLFKGVSADFQDVSVQGVITFRVSEPETLAARLDFSIDAKSGAWLEQPLEQLSGRLSELAQQIAFEYVSVAVLGDVLSAGTSPLRARIADGLAAERSLAEMGVEIVAVRVSAVRATAEVEKALQTPTRESIQQRADEAIFERRALAVEKERAIAENELANRIELTKREEDLVRQQGANARLEAREESAAEKIRASSAAELTLMDARSDAEATRLREGAALEAEERRMAIYTGLPGDVLLGLAARDFAGKLDTIEHLNITPELLGPMLTGLVSAATHRLEE